MSSLFSELWLKNPLDEQQLSDIDHLIHQIGTNVGFERHAFADSLPPALKPENGVFEDFTQFQALKPRPIDLVIEKTTSSKLKLMLTQRRKEAAGYLNHQNSLSWSFEFSNSAPLDGAPSADRYRFRDGGYPIFALS